MLLASLAQQDSFLHQHLEDDRPIINNSVSVSEDMATPPGKQVLRNTSATGVPAHMCIMRRLAGLPAETRQQGLARVSQKSKKGWVERKDAFCFF